MSQITKEQAAKVLVGYRCPIDAPRCFKCHFAESIAGLDNENVRDWFCGYLRSALGFVFEVQDNGECDHFKKREPL